MAAPTIHTPFGVQTDEDTETVVHRVRFNLHGEKFVSFGYHNIIPPGIVVERTAPPPFGQEIIEYSGTIEFPTHNAGAYFIETTLVTAGGAVSDIGFWIINERTGMTNINWSDVTLRYQVLSDYSANSNEQVEYIQYAEAEVDRRLAACFVVPFSSNNLTAKDIAIDITFANTIKFKDTEKHTLIMDQIDKITEALKKKQQAMILDDGTEIFADRSISGVGTTSSTTEDYPSPFMMGDHEDMQVSSEQLQDEYDARF